ncbi:hypothetical protein [uncultured Tolumonas sp.]|uniref:hypothetical protein n=1 Tax=uncultured Tolumonas sp. TaxID=263765 RepID=UPI002930026D|nr:hypothetical protein [uncultured Tolumonas sp.]
MQKMIAPSMTLLAVFCATSAFATEQTLGTQTGQELGVSLSSYKYEEPDFEPGLDVKSDGIKLGADYTSTMAGPTGWFFKFNGRLRMAKWIIPVQEHPVIILIITTKSDRYLVKIMRWATAYGLPTPVLASVI